MTDWFSYYGGAPFSAATKRLIDAELEASEREREAKSSQARELASLSERMSASLRRRWVEPFVQKQDEAPAND